MTVSRRRSKPQRPRRKPSSTPPPPSPSIVVNILAGGLSTRMGRDKSRLKIGARTLLGHALALARELKLPACVLRRDAVPRCGPLGGLFTGLKRGRADVHLFLACDMPFVPARAARRLLSQLRDGAPAVFTDVEGLAGFPLVLRRECLSTIEQQLATGAYSLQALAVALRAKRLVVPRRRRFETLNVNTPAELRAARASQQ